MARQTGKTAEAKDAAARLFERRQKVAAGIENGAAQGVPVRLSDLGDAYFRERLTETWPGGSRDPGEGPFALVAVGGYGRRELCLHSDIDLLVIYPGRIPTEALDLAQSLLVPLWDLGLDLGHGFRSIKDCLKLARKDFQVLTSLLDARFVAGNQDVFEAFAEKFRQGVLLKKKREITDFLVRESRVAEDPFSLEADLLEPDLKSGRGGLRDFHRLLWLGKVHFGCGSPDELLKAGALSEAESETLTGHGGFLLQVRNHLHLLAGRKKDRLHFDHQKRIAERMGFRRSGEELGVERFLAVLHRTMAGLHALLRSFREETLGRGRGRRTAELLGPGVLRVGGELEFDLPRDYPDDPGIMMRMFELSAKSGLPLSWKARKVVSGHLHLVQSSLADNFGAVESFERVLLSGGALATLEQMRETGFLGAFLPEFARIQDLVQFDTYHLYPVGKHTLMAVGMLEQLSHEEDPRLSPVWESIEDRLRVFWAVLFHDIGKGLGGGHSEKGAEIAARALQRIGKGERFVRDVEFLVREHLLLTGAATSADLGDESAVAQVAGRIGSRERLKMLYLLTYADCRATGPKAWSDWISSLVAELYHKVMRIFEQGALASPDALRRAMRTRDVLRAEGSRVMNGDRLERALENMPARYALTMRPFEILEHLELVVRLEEALAEDYRMKPGKSAGKGVFVYEVRHKQQGGQWEMVIAARDNPVLFQSIAGVFALLDMNILSAECFLWRDGIVVDRFTLSDLPDKLAPDELWERVGYTLRQALTGRLSLDYRLEEKRSSPLAPRSMPKNPEVSVDNTASDFFTLVSLKASDRIGLLYDAARAMHELGLAVHLAKIATYGDQVSDFFYVRDSLGQKLEDPELRKRVVNFLSRSMA
jgi:[protein-PII] uridylyltransferase